MTAEGKGRTAAIEVRETNAGKQGWYPKRRRFGDKKRKNKKRSYYGVEPGLTGGAMHVIGQINIFFLRNGQINI